MKDSIKGNYINLCFIHFAQFKKNSCNEFVPVIISSVSYQSIFFL